MMQVLKVKRIEAISLVEDVSMMFDKAEISYNNVSYINWKNYPYKPDVEFRIAHDGKNIYINWEVDEDDIKAVCDRDGGEVWKDSCVEFFITFGGSNYYNIETNCIGKVLVETGVDRFNRTKLDSGQIRLIRRWSSLGDKVIEGCSGAWEMSVIIPREIFILDSFQSFNGLEARANFYKCGDNLQQPHFLSWNPINAEAPNFHIPEFFGKIEFE